MRKGTRSAFEVRVFHDKNSRQNQRREAAGSGCNPTADVSRCGPRKKGKLDKLRVTAEISGNLKDLSGFH